MKIALFAYSLGAGGAERQIAILAREFVQRGFEVELFLVHKTIFYELPSSVKITVLDEAPLYLHPVKKLLKLIPLAKKYAKLCTADVSISFMNRPNYINILSKFFGNKAKIVVSERGTPSSYYRGFEGLVSKKLLSLLYPQADLVIANSFGVQRDLKHFGITNVKTIYNQFDLKEIEHLAKESIPEELQGFSFITIGRLDEGKNHILQIEAMRQLPQEITLYIIGEGPLREYLQQKIYEYDLQNRVFLLGKRSNVYAYLARAKAFSFSSKSEGFPNVLVEALACGLPIVSTDCPSGPAEILEQGKYGLLVPLNNKKAFVNAMLHLYKDKTLHHNLRKIATIRAKEFAKETIMKKWKEVIDVR